MKIKILSMVLIFTILLTGCSKPRLESIETKPSELSSVLAPSPLAINDKGVYFVEENFLYYMGWHNLKPAKLTAMTYADDKEVDDPTSFNYERYSESFSDGHLVLYGNYLYGVFELRSGDGSSKQILNRMDLKGENIERVITFDNFVSRFQIDSGKVYTYTRDEVEQKDFIEVYDNKFKSIDKIEFSQTEDAYSFYLDKGELIVNNEVNNSNTRSMILYDNGDKKISYDILVPLDQLDPDSDEPSMVGIFSNGDKEYKLEDKLITFVTEKYFYASNVSDIQVYQQYNLDGTLNKSIKPNHFIEPVDTRNMGLIRSDFPYVERIYNDRYIFGNSFLKYFMCDLELESCRYLNE